MKRKNRVKEFREKSKLSQNDLAIRVGVSQRYIAFIESGDREPSLNVALKLEKELGQPLAKIFLTEKCTKSSQKPNPAA